MDAIEAWQQVCRTWNTWFLRRPTGRPGDLVDQQWGQAISGQKIFHIQDEQRAVDYAMGLIARAWGHFGDFQDNMRARQDESKVVEVSAPIALTRFVYAPQSQCSTSMSWAAFWSSSPVDLLRSACQSLK